MAISPFTTQGMGGIGWYGMGRFSDLLMSHVMAIDSMSLVCLNSSMSTNRPWAFINSWAINVRLDINLFPVGSMKSMGFVIPNDLSLDDASGGGECLLMSKSVSVL